MLIQSTVPSDKPSHDLMGLYRLAFIFAEVVLIALVLHQVDMLPLAFRRVVYLATAGFVVHHLLPAKFRLLFFVLLSVGAMFLVLGTPTTPGRLWDPAAAVPRAGMILAIGTALIGICHLPIAFWRRVGVLIVAGTAAAVFRAGIFKSGGLEIIWIVLAASFMFRIVVYLYDLSTSPNRPSISQSLAYFFLIPNVCCTLFPVIDFKTFCRSHYNDMPLVIYQRGVRWMTRGVLQLLLYRFVDQILFKDAAHVESGTDLIRFLITNSLLYLNVSGSFHFIVGLLLLFGFNLPETNHNYFLASSFTDYWRRANIYWKDFMMKVFYYPTFFKFKKGGTTRAMVVATLWVFFVTWALHLYQTWWLKGSASAILPDILFWLILGLLILANSLWEMKRGRKRMLASSTYSVAEAAWLSLRTAGTFACICLVWSLWSSSSVSVWVGMWKHADRHTVVGGILVLVAIMVAKIILEVLPTWLGRPAAGSPVKSPAVVLWRREALLCVAPLLALYVVAHLALQSRLPDLGLERINPRFPTQRFYNVFEAGDSLIPEINAEELNYYKRLTSLDEGNRQLLEIFIGRALPRFPHDGNPPVVGTRDFRSEELKPSVHVSGVYETDDFQTNRWGMRDKDYDLVKPPGTLRIALLGSSNVMGYAVKQEEVFETIVEDRLNREPPPSAVHVHFEILNFAQSGYSPLGQIDVLHLRVRAFNPDLVLLVGHLHDFVSVNDRLRKTLQRGYPIPYEYLQQTLHDARVMRYDRDGLSEKRLRPFEPALIGWTFHQIVAECRAMGALPVYFFLPAPGLELPLTPEMVAKATMLKTLAAQAGFVVLDGSNLFDNQRVEDLVTAIVPHSNARAHALIADALYKQLTTDPRINLERLTHNAATNSTSSSAIPQPSQ